MSRTLDDLERHAVRFWPATLTVLEQRASVLPRLIESQDKFIAILYVADASPIAWKDTLRAAADMPANLFLKHLIVLTDVGGEQLERLHASAIRSFSGSTMHFRWKTAEHVYNFQTLARKPAGRTKH
jgi:hypothetical protein